MNITKKQTLRGVFCAALSGVCWGVCGVCGQYLFTTFSFDPTALTCIRLLSAGIIFLLFSLLRHREALVSIWKYPKDILILVAYALTGMLYNTFAYNKSIFWSNAATATMLLNLSPIVVMFVTCISTHRLPRRRETVALLLAIFGVFMLATGGNPSQMLISVPGLLWGLSTTIAGASNSLLPRPLIARWPRIPILGYAMLIGGVILNIAAKSWTFQFQLPPVGWLVLIACVFFGSIASYVLFLQGLKDLGPVKASLLAITEMLSAPIISALWLGTEFAAGDFIGFAAIISTVVLLSLEG